MAHPGEWYRISKASIRWHGAWWNIVWDVAPSAPPQTSFVWDRGYYDPFATVAWLAKSELNDELDNGVLYNYGMEPVMMFPGNGVPIDAALAIHRGLLVAKLEPTGTAREWLIDGDDEWINQRGYVLLMFDGITVYTGDTQTIVFSVDVTSGVEFDGMLFVGDSSGVVWIFDTNSKVFFQVFDSGQGVPVVDMAVVDGVLYAAIGNKLWVRDEDGAWTVLQTFATDIVDLVENGAATVLYVILAEQVSIYDGATWVDVDFTGETLRVGVQVGAAVWVFGDGGTLIIFDAGNPTGALSTVAELVGETITAAAYDSDSGILYVGTLDGTIYTWDSGWALLSERGAEIRDIIIFNGGVYVLLPDGYDIYDPLLTTWTSEAFAPLDLPSATLTINSVAFTYSVEDEAFILTIDDVEAQATDVVWNPTDSLFYALVGNVLYSSPDGTVWTLESAIATAVDGTSLTPVSLDVANDGSVYALFNRSDGAVQLGIMTDGIWTTVSYSDAVAAGAGFVAGVYYVVTTDGQLLVDGAFVAVPILFETTIVGAASTGSLLYVVDSDGNVYTFDGTTWVLLSTQTAAPIAIFSMDDGIVLVYSDHTETWDGATWTTVGIVADLTGNAWLLFDGDLFIGTSEDVELADRTVTDALILTFAYERNVIAGVMTVMDTSDGYAGRDNLRILYRLESDSPATRWRSYPWKALIDEPVPFDVGSQTVMAAIYRVDAPAMGSENYLFCPQYEGET